MSGNQASWILETPLPYLSCYKNPNSTEFRALQSCQYVEYPGSPSLWSCERIKARCFHIQDLISFEGLCGSDVRKLINILENLELSQAVVVALWLHPELRGIMLLLRISLILSWNHKPLKKIQTAETWQLPIYKLVFPAQKNETQTRREKKLSVVPSCVTYKVHLKLACKDRTTGGTVVLTLLK